MKFLPLLTFFVLISGCSSSPSPVLPPVELTKLDNQLQINKVWRKKIGDGVSENFLLLRPVINGDTGYVSDYEGNLVAFNVKTGKTIWSKYLNTPIATEIKVDANKLIFGNSQGEIWVLKISNGDIIWKSELTSEVLAKPQVSGNIIIAKTVDGKVFAFDAETGIKRWVYDRTVPLLTLRGNSAPVISNDILVTGSDNGKLSAIALSTGKLLWETTIAVAKGRNELERIVDIDATPIVIDDTVYTVSYQGRIAAVKLSSGQLIWARDFSSYTGLHVDAYRLYVTDSDGQVWALNRYNGSTLWRQDKLLRRTVTAPEAQNDYIVVGDYDGYLHWISRSEGKLVARYRMNNSEFDNEEQDKELEQAFSKWNTILVKPVVSNDLLIAYDRSGHLEAYQVKSE